MANPNIVNVTQIYGQTNYLTPANVSTLVLIANTSGSGNVFKVNQIVAANQTNTAANVTFTTGTNTAITIAQNNTFQAARSLRLNLVGTLAGTQYLYIPAITKQYIVNNGLTQSVIVSNGANTGATGTTVTVPAGKSVMIYNDAINVAPVITDSTVLVNPGTAGNVLTSNGTNWLSQAPAASGITTGKSIAMAMIFGF